MKINMTFFKSTFDWRDNFWTEPCLELCNFFKLQLCTDELTFFVFTFQMFNKLIILFFFYISAFVLFEDLTFIKFSLNFLYVTNKKERFIFC